MSSGSAAGGSAVAGWNGDEEEWRAKNAFSRHGRPRTETAGLLLLSPRTTRTSPELPGCYSVEKHPQKKPKCGLIRHKK